MQFRGPEGFCHNHYFSLSSTLTDIFEVLKKEPPATSARASLEPKTFYLACARRLQHLCPKYFPPFWDAL